MFYLIGTGLKPKQLTLEALNALKECDRVFIEKYTSEFSEKTGKELEKKIGRKAIELNRKKVEEEFSEKLIKAKGKNVALLVIGNALFATTHIQLLLDAEEKGIEWRVIPGISVQNYVGKTGLNAYRFGKTVSIVMPSEHYKPESFYDSILLNLKNGLHSLCLLDLKNGKKLTPGKALRLLLKIESKRGNSKIGNAKILVLGGLGSKKERILSGKAKNLTDTSVALPASLIVCAELSEKEKEGIKALTEVIE